MQHKIIRKLKSEEGSSLAFVIIIGVVILMLVASIMAIANSDFTFTQQSLESRRAYIDAKSVIEYGKIEINSRMKWLETKNIELKNMYVALEAADASEVSGIQTQINNKIAEIDSHMTAPYYIGGDKNNIIGSLKETASETDAFGILHVTPEVVATNTDTNVEELKYDFNITTQNLRRKLDYQVSLNYQAASISDTTGGIPSIPADKSDEWNDTQINLRDNGNKKVVITKTGNAKKEPDYTYADNTLTVNEPDLSLDIGRKKNNPNPNNVKFGWLQENSLNLTAKNICFTAPFPSDPSSVWKSQFTIKASDELRIKENYIQSSDSGLTNTLEAKNIVFEKNLTVNNNDNLVINCENLWIKGDLNINDLVGINSSITINAQNIIIGDYSNNTGGNITIGDQSKIIWNCTGSIMIRGNVNFFTNTTKSWDNKDYGNVLKAKNISIGTENNESVVKLKNNTKVTWDCENFWLHGKLTSSNTHPIIAFKNIKYLKAGDLELAQQTELTVEGATGSGSNQMSVKRIEAIPSSVPGTENNNHNINIKNLYSFTCESLVLNDNSSLVLQSNIIKITGTSGNLSSINNKNSPDLIKDANEANFVLDFISHAEITTEYFDVSGKTYLERLQGKLDIKPIEGKVLNVRFANGYRQILSTVNLSGTDLVVFGGVVNLTCDSQDSPWVINANAKRICLDSDLIKFQKGGRFNYSALGDLRTKVSLKSDIQQWDWGNNNTLYLNGTLLTKSNYIATVQADTIPNNLQYDDESPPTWVTINITLPLPIEPKGAGGTGSSGGGGTTGDVNNGKITPGSEKYY